MLVPSSVPGLAVSGCLSGRKATETEQPFGKHINTAIMCMSRLNIRVQSLAYVDARAMGVVRKCKTNQTSAKRIKLVSNDAIRLCLALAANDSMPSQQKIASMRASMMMPEPCGW